MPVLYLKWSAQHLMSTLTLLILINHTLKKISFSHSFPFIYCLTKYHLLFLSSLYPSLASLISSLIIMIYNFVIIVELWNWKKSHRPSGYIHTISSTNLTSGQGIHEFSNCRLNCVFIDFSSIWNCHLCYSKRV